ncbi:GyrI-like domain-containing protein [Candidatus Enterococcus mansonii]|uniref:Integron-associated effector binding protein domain-containing protein n=1 Tax=Candidatus Enterococcus mansonii TaxID=1834181 RepID=A0A242CIW7_9ENTE|nr:GyrI-like domain-containing protein [Enterococcus sp. 4G2_DIV0659]OTO10176.1 hypothetical protein A5880_000859 [Enterococcus sp. 4G2_DIV0659]
MIKHLTKMTIQGKKIRTNNQKIEEIIHLWHLVPQMELNGDIYAVYSNYESNFLGDYDLLIGNEEANDNSYSVINAGNYIQIPVEKATPEGVGEAWQEIWMNKELEEKRTYQSDFEHYRKDGKIVIYLSV